MNWVWNLKVKVPKRTKMTYYICHIYGALLTFKLIALIMNSQCQESTRYVIVVLEMFTNLFLWLLSLVYCPINEPFSITFSIFNFNLLENKALSSFQMKIMTAFVSNLFWANSQNWSWSDFFIDIKDEHPVFAMNFRD